MDQDQFIAQERAKLDAENAKVATLFADAGIDPQTLPQVDLANIEPEVRQQLTMQFGVDFALVPVYKPKTASAWRQRTKAIMV